MKKQIVTLLFLFTAALGFGQGDTLFLYHEKILCSVKEITTDEVKFIYPNEEVLNSVYKNAVQKIVFKNRRIQVFAEASSIKNIASLDDYEHITISQIEGEVKGLYKLGEVSAKAKGTTVLSDQERVKRRAYRKLKMEAALMGANVVYLLHQRDQGNRFGGLFQSGSSSETSLTGVAYSNQLVNFDEFKNAFTGRPNFIAVQETSLFSSGSNLIKRELMHLFDIYSISNDNGIVTIQGSLQGETLCNSFRLVSFDAEFFYVYYETKISAHNIKIRKL
jgi:hypothetical protein